MERQSVNENLNLLFIPHQNSVEKSMNDKKLLHSMDDVKRHIAKYHFRLLSEDDIIISKIEQYNPAFKMNTRTVYTKRYNNERLDTPMCIGYVSKITPVAKRVKSQKTDNDPEPIENANELQVKEESVETIDTEKSVETIENAETVETIDTIEESYTKSSNKENGGCSFALWFLLVGFIGWLILKHFINPRIENKSKTTRVVVITVFVIVWGSVSWVARWAIREWIYGYYGYSEA